MSLILSARLRAAQTSRWGGFAPPTKGPVSAFTFPGTSFGAAPQPTSRLSPPARRNLSAFRASQIHRNAALDAAASSPAANPPPNPAAPPTVNDKAAIQQAAVAQAVQAAAAGETTPEPPPTKRYLNNGQLWVSGILPLKLSRFDIRHWFAPRSRLSLRSFAEEKIVPKDIFPRPFEVTSVVPAPKEGGVVLKYGYDGTKDELLKAVSEHLKKTHVRTWYNWTDIEAHGIRGVPFIEDLVERHPSSWLKVDFKGPALSVEALFNLFRPYGRIADIIPAADGKSAKVIYISPRNAVTAQNCLLGYKEGETVLSVEYLDPAIVGKWMEWFQKNTRLAIVLIGFIVALISFLVLEPTRRFLIANKVTKDYSPKGLMKPLWALVERLKARAGYKPRQGTASAAALQSEGLEEVKEYAERVLELCKGVPETFQFIVGPKGSGKNQLLAKIMDDSAYDLSLKLEEIQAQGTDALVLKTLTQQLGYWPQFTFFARFAAMADALITAATGTSAGLASTPQQDFKAFLDTATFALKNIVARQHAENSKLESQGKPPKPVQYPVIIIEGFASKDRARGKNAWTNDAIAEWAAALIENKIAHCVFSTKNPMSVRFAAKFLPTKTFELFILHDKSYQNSYNYIKGQLVPAPPTPAEIEAQQQSEDQNQQPAKQHIASLEQSIDPKVIHTVLNGLGGRLTDLEALVTRIKAATMVANEHGEKSEISTSLVQECYDDLVTRVISEVRKAGFGETPDEAAKLPWTPTQFWYIVKQLSENETVNYDDVKNAAPFGRQDAALLAMEDAEIIALEHEKGRPMRIRVGRPIARVAFRQMVKEDVKFAAAMNVKACEETISALVKKFIEPAEAELEKLQNIMSGTGGSGGLAHYMGWEDRRALEERIRQLTGAVAANTDKIAGLSEERAKWAKLM